MDKMEFEEFTAYVRENIADYLMSYDIAQIDIVRVNKNNGIVRTGLSILLEGENMSPNIYLEYFYQDYTDGKDIEDVLQDITGAYLEAREAMLKTEYSTILNETNRSQLYLKAVNYNRNRAMLEGTVYERYMDLALQVRVILNSDENGRASMALTYSLLDMLNMGRTEAFQAAKENTPKLFPARCDSLINTLGVFYEIGDAEKALLPDIYVLTTEQNIDGSVYIAYEDVIADMLEKNGIKGDAFIIPSSMHEILLIGADQGIGEEFLSYTVQEVNHKEVSEIDFLSDNIYKYDARERTITQLTDVHNERIKERDNEMER